MNSKLDLRAALAGAGKSCGAWRSSHAALTRIVGVAAIVSLGSLGARAQGPCQADQVVLNTGYDPIAANGSVLPIGALDPRWIVVLDQQSATVEPRPAAVIAHLASAWAPPDPQSQWISTYASSAQGTNGAYVFKTVFCLQPGIDLDASSLQFGMRGDDASYAYLNEDLADVLGGGSAVPFHLGNGFATASLSVNTYTLASLGAVVGLNTLYVRVENTGGGAMGLNVVATVVGSPSASVNLPECCEGYGVLQGSKYNDLNGNGVRDGFEPGLAGWQIDLTGVNGTNLSVLTDSLGVYSFVDLPSSTYTLSEVQQPGWRQTAPSSGSHVVVLSALQGVNQLDFGNVLDPCTDGGGGGAIPSAGTGDGTWPAVLPSAPMVGSLAVNVGAGAVINSITLHGLTHTWVGDLQIVLVTPSGNYNVLHRPGFTGSNLGCPDDLAGDYTIVDPMHEVSCYPIEALPCGGGTIAPGTYVQQFGNWTSGPDALNIALESIPLTAGQQTWDLIVYDWVSADVGALVSWEVCLGPPTPTPPPPGPAPLYACTGSTGPGGNYPLGGVFGAWPIVLPLGQLSSPLAVTVPAGSTKITAVKIYGWNHDWYDDTQIVLQAPPGLGGFSYNVLQANDGALRGPCGDTVSGDYTFVDGTFELGDCGWPAGAPPACSGSIPPRTYLQTYGTWPSGSAGVLNVDLQSIPIGGGVWTLHLYDWFPVADDGSITGWELCFDQAAPPIYCTGGTSSNGCVANIAATAQPSASFASACQITVIDVEGNKSGIFYYGLAPHSAPWGTGSTSFLCVKAPTQRVAAQSSGGTTGACNGSFALDWSAWQATHPSALGQPWLAGSTAYVQAWYRDPPAPKTTNLSNAVELTYQP